jgi:regulator of replication initiation timing
MLKDIKLKFTEITGLPAKKAFVVVVVSDIDDRKMRSTTDWEWAVENVLPQFRLNERSDDPELLGRLSQAELALSIAESKAEDLEERVNDLDEENQQLMMEIQKLEAKVNEANNLKTDEEVIVFAAVNGSDEIVEPLFESLLTNDIAWHKKLSKAFHPDTTKLNKQKAQELFILLTTIYQGIKNHETKQYPKQASESSKWNDGYDVD